MKAIELLTERKNQIARIKYIDSSASHRQKNTVSEFDQAICELEQVRATIKTAYDYLEKGGNIECGSVAHGEFEEILDLMGGE